MGATFDNAQLQRATPNFYEKLPYTALYTTLQQANSVVTQISDVFKASNNQGMAIVSDLAATQEESVDILLYQESNSRQISSEAMPPSLAPIMNKSMDSGMRATKKIGVTVANNTGATPSNYQVNFMGSVKRLTVADKVLRGLPLSSYEQGLAKKFQIGNQGTQPPSLTRSMQRAFYGQILDEYAYGWRESANASVLPITNEVPDAGEILVITSLAASAPVGNQVTLTLERDNDNGYVSILADNMSLSQPFDVWIPVQRHYTLSLSSIVSTASVPIRMTVLRIKLSTILQAMFGLLDVSELKGEELTLYEKIISGKVI